MFLAVRLYCSFVMEYDIHTLLDLATLATTLWVIYMIRFKLTSTYMNDKDKLALHYLVSLLLIAIQLVFLMDRTWVNDFCAIHQILPFFFNSF